MRTTGWVEIALMLMPFAIGLGCGGQQNSATPSPHSAVVREYLRNAALCDDHEQPDEVLEDACIEVSYAQSPCENGGIGEVCDYLRSIGELPQEPPPIAELYGCWQSIGGRPNDPVFCFEEDGVAVRSVGIGWDRWALGERKYYREDSTTDAFYGVDTEVVPIRLSFSGPMHLSIGGTLVATYVQRSSVTVPRTLPTIETICDSLDRCLQALERARAPAPDPNGTPDYEGEGLDVPSLPRASLRGCHCAPRELRQEQWSFYNNDTPLPTECESNDYDTEHLVACPDDY